MQSPDRLSEPGAKDRARRGVKTMIRLLGVAGLVAALTLAGLSRAGDEKKDPAPAKKARAGKGAVDLESIFKKLDTNGDGVLSLEESKRLPEVYKPAGRRRGFGDFDPVRFKKL